MNLALRLPDDIAALLAERWSDLERHALEALAADSYRHGVLTSRQVQELLGLSSRWETETFLREAGAWLAYDLGDYEDDVEALAASR